MYNNHLLEQVYSLATFSSVFALFIGIALITYGINVEITIMLMCLHTSITGVLFYGVRRKDTTHILVWLVCSLIEAIFCIAVMCYFAIESEDLLRRYNHLKMMDNLHTPNNKILKELGAQQYSYLAFSIAFGIFTVILLSSSVTVKKFYDEILRRGNHRPYGTHQSSLLEDLPQSSSSEAIDMTGPSPENILVMAFLAAAATGNARGDDENPDNPDNELAEPKHREISMSTDSSLQSHSDPTSPSSNSSCSGGGEHRSPGDTPEYTPTRHIQHS